MPYQGEFAHKSSHSDIIKNPDVDEFLSQCEYLTEPSDEEGKAIGARFVDLPPLTAVSFPQCIISMDGSLHESDISKRLPSTKIGYVKIGSILIDMNQFNSLRVDSGQFVDPFRVAKLKNHHDALTFTLPSANVKWNGKETVQDGFRAVVDQQLYDEKTRFNPNDANTSLRTTLFHLASRRVTLGTGDPTRLKIHKCPNPDCDSHKNDKSSPIEVQDVPHPQYCPHCKKEVYPSDCLRLWEHVSEYQSNSRAISLFMTTLEHLLVIHYLRYLAEHSLSSLAATAFFLDNPLAIFDVTAWLIEPIMRYLHEVNTRLVQANYAPLLFIGLQKNGQVVDHVSLIERYIQPGSILAIDDDYRYKYILVGRDPSEKGFGSQTYYGQDFIYKTPSKRCFVFALPYPFVSKNRQDFTQVKTDYTLYTELPRALALINHFETSLYKNAVVPIALAHQYTAISLVPGGRILDLLSQKALKSKA